MVWIGPLTALEAKLALEDAIECLVVLARERSIDYRTMSRLAHNERCRATYSGLVDKRDQYHGFLGFNSARLTVATHDRGDVRLHAAKELDRQTELELRSRRLRRPTGCEYSSCC